MAEARIHARQRAFADFRQHAHPDRGFLISRGVRYTVGVAAGEKIHGTLCRVHRHVQFLSFHPVGYQRMGGHAGSGDHTGNPELSENRVSQGRPSGALSHDRI